MRPYVMTALRNPLLWMLPAVLLPLLVAVGAIMTSRQSQRGGERLDAGLVPDRYAGDNGSFQPPAQIEANTFNERLNTESFRPSIITCRRPRRPGEQRQVAGEIGSPQYAGRSFPLTKPLFGGSLPDAAANHDRALAAVKSSLSAEVRGNNLLFITYKGGGTDDDVALVQAALDTYQKQNLGINSTRGAVGDRLLYQGQVNADQQAWRSPTPTCAPSKRNTPRHRSRPGRLRRRSSSRSCNRPTTSTSPSTSSPLTARATRRRGRRPRSRPRTTISRSSTSRISDGRSAPT